MSAAGHRSVTPPALDPNEVEARLAEGWGLPASLYTDPSIERLEDDLIWRQAWQEVGVLADFRNPGDHLTAQLGRFPVLVVRDADGELRAFLNVCRHRGALVVGGERGDQSDNVSGNCKVFTCRYHGWTYRLDGSLKGAPHWKEGELPPFETLGLVPVSVDTWAGIVFVSIDPAEPLTAYLSDLPHVAEQESYSYPFLGDDLQLAGVWEWPVPANWKAFMENNIECYHCPITHTDSLASVFKVDMKNFCAVNFRHGNHLKAPFTDRLESAIDTEAARALRAAAEARGEMPFQQYWIWPNNMITTGVGVGNNLLRIDPTGPQSCRLVARVYLQQGDMERERERLDHLVGTVTVEDVAVSAGVQIGLASGAREWGPLVAGREETLRWFSKQVWEHLAPAFR